MLFVLLSCAQLKVLNENGIVIKFDDNAAVMSTKGNPRGTRVFGPIARELRDKNYKKLSH
jgi:large subunit ribosomal protein L14